MNARSPETPLRKVLIISPHFPPVNAPDMQRTRLALPYLRACGWEPVVLAVDPEMVEGAVLDPLFESTYPSDIRVVRVRGIPPAATRWAGFGSLWLRCGDAIRSAGEKLLGSERFDLVFASTTQFDAFSLCPRWRARFNVPYVIDYQDPWINDYYRRTHTRPPGGWLKFGLSQFNARRREPRALRDASGIIAVSTAYATTLAATYPWFDERRVEFLPFGAAENDFEVAKRHKPAESLVPFGDGNIHLVYTGRCGPDMSISLTIVFRAFKRFLSARPDEARRFQFHFIGTDYAPRPLGREWVIPTAKSEGVSNWVHEHCYRVPYFDALYYLTHADALVAIGSNDPTYSASKIFPFILARRPMIVVFGDQSSVVGICSELNQRHCYIFRDAADIDTVAEKVADSWFLGGALARKNELDLTLFHPYTAESMTHRLAQCFDRAAGPGRQQP
jgi:hypothetical protein